MNLEKISDDKKAPPMSVGEEASDYIHPSERAKNFLQRIGKI